MEAISRIHERWKLCTFASILGCFILLMCLNRSHDVRNLVHTIALQSSSDIDFLGSGISENVKPIHQRDVKCNMFKGRWVYKPMENLLYDDFRCPFLSDQVSCQRHGRPDFQYEKWSWEAHECEIPRFDGRDMLERLRGKRVVLVGDSLNRNQWESLACLLYSAIPSSTAEVDFQNGSYKVFRAKDYNVSVEFYWSPFLVQLDTKQANGTKILRLDKIDATARRWHGADVMVFNTGHWWVHRGKFRAWDMFGYEGKLVEEMNIEKAFAMAMKTWENWVDDNVLPTKTSVYFRSISPEHKGKDWCYNVTQPIEKESPMVASFPEPLMEIVRATFHRMRTPVRYLNITELSRYRRDAHSTIYGTKTGKQLIEQKGKRPEHIADCSHWCLPGLPDTWNRLLYASMVLDTSGGGSAAGS
ncbi:hypothetical protein RJ640_018221 [Escallonia rubra]|uniref:Trichome birefringence-like N-terminal domain-containing protein n=1 Tax=Escallonia rubra TaxID=112253 RepID=A0AA88QLI9_9ASTE|nr:hypothetical protein RJ640_018221 [Escallonia rubra]